MILYFCQQTIEEFATRVGQQAVVLVATPGKPNTSYRVFGAKPLEDVVRNLRCMIMEELENALAQQVSHTTLHYMPPVSLLYYFQLIVRSQMFNILCLIM